MNLSETMEALEACGTAQNRKVYARHGAREPMFGVSFANLGKLKKEIKTDHALARQLWASGNHDARMLAMMIADPAQVTDAELESWAKGLEDYVLTDAFSRLAAQTPMARRKVEQWIDRKSEWISAAGWHVFCHLANQPGAFEAGELGPILSRIEKEIHGAPNRTRYAMNNALITIGMHGGDLMKRAIAAARRIGKVDVDHGETGCKTPDAAAYIAKAVEYQAGRKKSTATRAASKKTVKK